MAIRKENERNKRMKLNFDGVRGIKFIQKIKDSHFLLYWLFYLLGLKIPF